MIFERFLTGRPTSILLPYCTKLSKIFSYGREVRQETRMLDHTQSY